MRVVVIGASGNVGTSLLEALQRDRDVDSVLALARRVPRPSNSKVEWREADIASSDLVAPLRGADAVVHLAWQIQPSHDQAQLRAVNVDGSRRVFDAVAEARVPALVYASSVGAYSRGPKDRRVDESWPTEGTPTSFYGRHKAEVEKLLDRFELEQPSVRVTRLRPGLIFKREAASEVRRYFAGPLVPRLLIRRRWIPVVPRLERLRFQAVHSNDVGEAYRLAVTREVRGPFNIAAEPVLDSQRLAALLDARAMPVPAAVLRSLTALTWRLHLQPTPPGWLDMALDIPLMDTARAKQDLDWAPRFGADEALIELIDGIGREAGGETPPLAPKAGGALRVREFLTGVGGRR
jgi:UDP-glucose 4-epimerase